jgi:hypothetical protein
MIATGIFVNRRRAAKLARCDDERSLEQPFGRERLD